MLDKVVKTRLVKIDYGQLAAPFRLRNETDNLWRCEFWGKVVRSAVYAWTSTQNPELKERIDRTVADLLDSQTPDGCISSYPAEKQLEGWDIWGRKYVLLGLLAYYREMNSDPAVLDGVRRCARHLVRRRTFPSAAQERIDVRHVRTIRHKCTQQRIVKRALHVIDDRAV
ncbi:MAG: glycoside hydrolase family 127 protein, partial [Lentisphaeria bacterium]|nr:glycoside hydrolase family 127 protein [Lentisphaeria bacterium]